MWKRWVRLAIHVSQEKLQQLDLASFRVEKINLIPTLALHKHLLLINHLTRLVATLLWYFKWNGFSNRTSSSVNKLFEGSSYPGIKMTCINQQKNILACAKCSRLTSKTSSNITWWNLIVSSFLKSRTRLI